MSRVRRRAQPSGKHFTYSAAALNLGMRVLALVVLIPATIESAWPWRALGIFGAILIALLLVVNSIGSYVALRAQRSHAGV